MNSCEARYKLRASGLILVNIFMQWISSCTMPLLAWVLPRVRSGIRKFLSSPSSRIARSRTGVRRRIDGAGVVVGAGAGEGPAGGEDTGESEGASGSMGNRRWGLDSGW